MQIFPSLSSLSHCRHKALFPVGRISTKIGDLNLLSLVSFAILQSICGRNETKKAIGSNVTSCRAFLAA